MAYQNILAFDEKTGSFATQKEPGKKPASTKPKKKETGRGCEFCTLNNIRGLHKVKNLDRLQGKKIMIWAQNPGQEENKKGLELVGPAGQLLWQQAAQVGLKREDCDIQNVVRCWTIDVNEETDQWNVRNPSKEEIKCCSLYTDEALEKVAGKTKVHIVLGQVAAKALLKGEYRKDQKTFYSERMKAWVILTYHPSYFLRGAPRSKLKEFRDALATAMQKAEAPLGKFAYVKSLDYRSVKAVDLEQELVNPILEVSKAGIVISVDIEDGVNEQGENVITYVGFGWKKGHSRGVWLAHKNLRIGAAALRKKLAVLKRLLEDPTIKKTLHYGTYDVSKLWNMLRIAVKGFVHDTILSEYLRYPGRKYYGLESIADTRFREFAGYKGILDEYRDKETGMVNFYTLPMRVEEIYNGADCDLTKRVQKSNTGKVHETLLRCLMRASPVLAKMELWGPFVDFDHAKLLDLWLPVRLENLLKEIRGTTGNPEFKPLKPQDVSEYIYDHLKLGEHLDARIREEFPRGTKEEIMLILANFDPFPELILEYRKLYKKKSTYLDAFRKSAERYDGRVRTKWHLTGTITLRLRSGGEKGTKRNLVNLQNIHGAAEIECLLVSDLRWRDLYRAWKEKKRNESSETVR